MVRTVIRRGRKVLLLDFRYVDKAGVRQRYRQDATIQTRTAARAEEARLLALATTTGSVIHRGTAPTLTAYVDGVWSSVWLPQYRKSTRLRYLALLRQGITATFGATALDAITTMRLRAFGTALISRGVNPRGHLNLLRTLFRTAVEAGALAVAPEVPPMGKVGRKLPDAPDDAEVAAMIRAAMKPTRVSSTAWILPAIVLAYDAGLRSGEIRALEVGDCKDGIITVRRAFSEDEDGLPKSGHARLVPMTKRLRAVLETACKGKLPKARVVLNTWGKTPARQQLLGAVRALQARHGLPARSVHRLRHGFVSRLIRGGVSVEVVRVLAGHGSIGVTNRYAHATGGELIEAMRKVEDE